MVDTVSSASTDAASAEPIRTREASWTTIVLGLGSLVAVGGGLLAVQDQIRFYFLVVFCAWLVAIGGAILLYGKLRPADIGLLPHKITEAVIVIVAAWLAMQAVLAVSALLGTETLQWHEDWQHIGIAQGIANLAAMLLVIGLFEEILFRGFLLPQLCLKSSGSYRARIWTAAIISSLIFGVMHIPVRMFGGVTGLELVFHILFISLLGLLFVGIYLRTRNLWVVIGLHGLCDAPTPLVASPLTFEIPLLSIMVALLIIWPWLTRQPEHRGFARIITTSTEPPRNSVQTVSTE